MGTLTGRGIAASWRTSPEAAWCQPPVPYPSFRSFRVASPFYILKRQKSTVKTDYFRNLTFFKDSKTYPLQLGDYCRLPHTVGMNILVACNRFAFRGNPG